MEQFFYIEGLTMNSNWMKTNFLVTLVKKTLQSYAQNDAQKQILERAPYEVVGKT